MSKVTFSNRNNAFYNTLKTEVENYFNKRSLKKTGNWKLFLKTCILVPLAIILYLILMIFHWPVTAIVLFGGLLGFVHACIGFNVMHDANHGSYSEHKWVNEMWGLTMNALGSNAFIWKQKHNVIHHTYPNVDGMDDDIAKSPVIRQCATQKWIPIHRIQHLYLPLIYSLSSILWTYFTDFLKYFNKKVYTTPMNKMDAKEHIIFWGSKLLYTGFYILLPIFIKGWFFWLLFFISLHCMLGLTLAIVFQLAHVVEHTVFESASVDPKIIESEWAVYQVKSTANFATKNKVISWLTGGFNFQIEHHLFPRVSHIHYPALSKIVKKICGQYNVPYHDFPTMWSAVVSHFRFMKQLGKRPVHAIA